MLGPDRLSPGDRLLVCCAGIPGDEASGRRAGDALSRPLDWDGLVDKSLRHGVACLLHSYLSGLDARNEVPAGVSRRLENIYYANALRAMRAEEQLDGILGRLAEAGVAVILLKGVFLSKTVYKNAAIRPIGDIDLLIHRKDIDRTDRLLREMGFAMAPGSFPLMYYRGVHFHVMYVGGSGPGSIPLEIHWNLKDRFSLLGIDMDEIWAGVRPWSIGGRTISAMCTEDLLAYLCYHAEKHTCFSRYIEDYSGLGPEIVLGNTASAELLWYADILRLLVLERHNVRWSRLAEKCRRWGIEAEVFATLAVTDRVFGTSVAAEPLGLLRPPKTRRLQAGIYRRLMRSSGTGGGSEGREGRRRLLESGFGLQFRPVRLLDILDYVFPDPDRAARCFRAGGPGLPIRYLGHVLTSAFRVVSSLGLLIGSILWRAVARPRR